MELKGKNIAISACLIGNSCRWDGSDKKDSSLIEFLKNQGANIISFCPEDFAFGTPREPIDLILLPNGEIEAIGKYSKEKKSSKIIDYAFSFFKNNNIDIFIGKSKSPSCGVNNSKLYDEEYNILSENLDGIMSSIAKENNIPTFSEEEFKRKVGLL